MAAEHIRGPHFWGTRPLGLPTTTPDQLHQGLPPPGLPLYSIRPTRAPAPVKKQESFVPTTSCSVPSSSSQRLSYDLEVLDSLLSSSTANHDNGVKKPHSGPGTSRQRGRPKGSLNKKDSRMSNKDAGGGSVPKLNYDPAKMAELNDRVAVGERSEIREYKCKMCPLRFFNRSDVVMHSRSHTEGKPYKCAVCNKGFASTSYLNQHSRIHTGEKPYNCSYCDKNFRQLSHLQQHTRTHTGQRPYRCRHDGCEKAFTQLSNLQQHWRRHNKDKPYKCPDCYRAFDVLEKLQNHVQSHENTRRERRFSCGVCGKTYVQELYLEKHLASKHPQEPPPPPPPPPAAAAPGEMNHIPSQVPFKRLPVSTAPHLHGITSPPSTQAPGFLPNQNLVIPRTHVHGQPHEISKLMKNNDKDGSDGTKDDKRDKEHQHMLSSVPSSLYPQVHFPLFNAGYPPLPGFSSLRS